MTETTIDYEKNRTFVNRRARRERRLVFTLIVIYACAWTAACLIALESGLGR